MPGHKLHLSCCHDLHDAYAFVTKHVITSESLQLDLQDTKGIAVFGSLQGSSCPTDPKEDSSNTMAEMPTIAV